MVRQLLAGIVASLLLSGHLFAQTDEWKFDVVHRTGGRAPYRGLVTEQTDTHIRILTVSRKPGMATTVLPDVVPRKEIAELVLLDDKERAVLKNRLETLSRERTVLMAQSRLWKGGKLDLPPNEML